MQHEFQHHAAGLLLQNTHGSRGGHSAVDFHTDRKARQLFFRYAGAHRNTVHLRHMCRRVRDEICKIAVVCHEQQALGVFIEAADGE